ncbi:AAA family ATPase, partial [Streptococcus pyogenes]
LVISQGRTPIVNEAMVQQLVSFASDPDVGLLVYDPLVDIHEVDEGDNPQMNTVMRVMKRIAKQANVASLINHHTTKAGSSRQEDRVGNMD